MIPKIRKVGGFSPNSFSIGRASLYKIPLHTNFYQFSVFFKAGFCFSSFFGSCYIVFVNFACWVILVCSGILKLNENEKMKMKHSQVYFISIRSQK